MLPSILLIEDQLLLAQFMQRDLATRYDVTMVSNVDQATMALASRKYDIALLDLKLDQSGNLLGLGLLPIILRNGAKPIVVSAHCSAHACLVCQANGVVGYIDKIHCAGGLVPVIEAILAGQTCFPEEWRRMLSNKDLEPLPELTRSERMVLDLLLEAQTRTNEDIGKLLNRAPDSVRNTFTCLFHKFNIKSRHTLANEARQRGYLPAKSNNAISQAATTGRLHEGSSL